MWLAKIEPKEKLIIFPKTFKFHIFIVEFNCLFGDLFCTQLELRRLTGFEALE